MGDLGYFDEDGFLFLVDRDGDVIKTGAFKVSTLQVENALHEHPGVADAAVFGLGHPVLGTVPAAAVVLGAAQTTAVQLRAFLAPRVAPHAVPHRFLFLAELPRNPAGKVLKRRLRDEATQSGTARAERSDARVQESAVTIATPAQHGVWLTEQTLDCRTLYHLPIVVDLSGPVNEAALLAACRATAARASRAGQRLLAPAATA